ncbi:MAG TPA: lysophospholipid acyltransferase family protein [Fimbriimonadaceae bacterium]|nr:lysophospholipid acyltransferase family protein [Fimbriimonadaceae bacterium]
MNRKVLVNKIGAFAFRRALAWMKNKNALQAERSGQRLGRFAMKLAKKQRVQTLANLQLAFPEQAAEWHDQMRVRVFEHFGMLATDFLRTPQRSDDEVREHMTYDGYENFQEALAFNKGVLVLTAHFGNWERMAQFSRVMGYPLTVVARDANDEGLNKMVMELRHKTGIEVLSRGNAARGVIERLRKNQIVAMLPDQNSSESFLTFFGKPCGTVLGPGVLHLRTGAPIVTAYGFRKAPGEYHVTVGKMIEGETAEEIMTKANLALETIIREHPEQYLWMHDRWRSAKRKGLI